MLLLKHWGRYAFAAQLVAGKRVLDLGCGAGHGSRFLKRAGAAEVVGVEASAEAVSQARAYGPAPGFEFVVGEPGRPPVLPGAFDLLVSFGTLGRVAEPGGFLRACRQLVRPDGVLLFSLPDAADGGTDPAPLTALLAETFPTCAVLPLSFSLGASIGGPAGRQAVTSRVLRAGEEGTGPDCHIALCAAAGAEVPYGDLLVPAGEAFGPEGWAWPGSDEESAAALARALHEARSWRAVAQERDLALEELERLNEWLEKQNGRQEKSLEELGQHRDRLEQQLAGLRDRNQALAGQLEQEAAQVQQAAAILAALGPSLRARVARRLKALFPVESLHGRAVRRGVRLASRVFKRSA
jgi:SAM-dependent methyltransferase